MVYAENEGEVFLGRSVTKTTNMSEETMQQGRRARSAASSTSSTRIARKLIEDNQDKMHAMAKALLEWETIDTEQIDDIMDGKPPRPPKDWTPSASKPSGRRPAGRARTARRPRPEPAATVDVRTGLRPRSFPCERRTRCTGRPRRFRIDLDAPAGDGHRQRHARLVLRRRPRTPTPLRRCAHCERLRGRGRRHPRHRRRIDPARAPRRCRVDEELARVLPVLRGAR